MRASDERDISLRLTSISRAALRSIFFLIPPRPPVIHTLSLHDALPISQALTTRRRNLLVGIKLRPVPERRPSDRKSTRLNSSHVATSYAVFCLKKKRFSFAGCQRRNRRRDRCVD